MKTTRTQWWLEEEETCGSCLQVYSYGVEYRCDICDSAVCPECVVVQRETRLVLCSRCQDEGEKEE
jgi:hypothetical protein